MLDFVMDSIFVLFGGRVFQQTIGIPVGTNSAPILRELFYYGPPRPLQLSKRAYAPNMTVGWIEGSVESSDS